MTDDIMSDWLTIISRSGRVFEMGDCWQILLVNPPLQQSRSLERTWYESLEKLGFYVSLRPKSPLRMGTPEKLPVSPFLRGARGNLSLIVKRPSVTAIEVKLTPMGIAVFLQIWYTIRFCRKTTLLCPEFVGKQHSSILYQLYRFRLHSPHCWLLTVDCWLLTVDCWLLTND